MSCAGENTQTVVVEHGDTDVNARIERALSSSPTGLMISIRSGSFVDIPWTINIPQSPAATTLTCLTLLGGGGNSVLPPISVVAPGTTVSIGNMLMVGPGAGTLVVDQFAMWDVTMRSNVTLEVESASVRLLRMFVTDSRISLALRGGITSIDNLTVRDGVVVVADAPTVTEHRNVNVHTLMVQRNALFLLTTTAGDMNVTVSGADVRNRGEISLLLRELDDSDEPDRNPWNVINAVPKTWVSVAGLTVVGEGRFWTEAHEVHVRGVLFDPASPADKISIVGSDLLTIGQADFMAFAGLLTLSGKKVEFQSGFHIDCFAYEVLLDIEERVGTGSATARHCFQCPPYSLTRDDGINCASCLYPRDPTALSNQCPQCGEGGQPNEKATSCDFCPEGFAWNMTESGSLECVACPVGMGPAAFGCEVVACPDGQFFSSRVLDCVTCPNNEFFDLATGDCFPCPQGRLGSGTSCLGCSQGDLQVVNSNGDFHCVAQETGQTGTVLAWVGGAAACFLLTVAAVYAIIMRQRRQTSIERI